MKLSSYFILIIFFVFCFFKAKNQEVSWLNNFQSPTAAALVSATTTPISLFTGVPSIEIPLYKVNIGDIPLELKLKYDASGIRVNSHPGPVGQNWVLEAGGIITRSIQGLPDELINDGNLSLPFPKRGYLYHYMVPENYYGNMYAIADSVKYFGFDYQPDIFSFNFLGLSGQFFMDNDGIWKVKSDKNFKIVMGSLIDPIFTQVPNTAPGISCIQASFPKIIGGFTIIDDKGNKFYFGDEGNAIEYSIDFFGQCYCQCWNANSWYLSRVVNSKGVEVYRFEYERYTFIADFYYAILNRTYQDESFLYAYGTSIPIWGYSCYGYQSTPSPEEHLAGSLILPVYLKRIFTSSPSNFNLVNFEYSESIEKKYPKNVLDATRNRVLESLQGGINLTPIPFLESEEYGSGPYIDMGLDYFENLKWRQLDNIFIHPVVDNRPQEKIHFIFNDNENERLQLNDVKIYSNDWWKYLPNEGPNYSYRFSYQPFNGLCEYLSRKEDHWGYYNGNQYNVNTPEYFYTQRQTDADSLLNGVISKIIWPTKGTTEFVFEANDYSKYFDPNTNDLVLESGYAGGLRIKQIIENDGITSKTTTYKYVKDYENNPSSIVSSGILRRKSMYLWESWTVPSSVPPYTTMYNETVFAVNNLIPNMNFWSPTIGYSEVIELHQNMSYSVYKFTNFDYTSNIQTYIDESPLLTFWINQSPFIRNTDLGLVRGKLYQKTDFSDLYKKVKQTDYYYSALNGTYPDNRREIYGTDGEENNICPNGGSNISYLTGSVYKIYYYNFPISDIKTRTFSSVDNAFVEQEEHFYYVQYPYYDLEKKRWTTIDNNLSEEEETWYVMDFLDSSPPNGSPLYALIENHMLGTPLEIKKTKTINQTNEQVGGIGYSYLVNDQLPILNKKLSFEADAPQVHPPRVFCPDGEIALPDFYKDATIYDDYDEKNNLRQYHNDNDIYTTLIWGYNYCFPIAKIENSTWAEVESYLNYSEIQTLSTYNELLPIFSQLRNALSNARITTYTYYPYVGIATVSDYNGITTFYEYDEFNRLKFIRDSNSKILKQYEYHYKSETYK